MTLEHDHSEDSIRVRLAEDNHPNYIRDWVYGGIDGAVTTFAIVAGVVGAELATKVILILGLANLVGDGFSMAASNYSGTKTEVDDAKRNQMMKEAQRIHFDDVGHIPLHQQVIPWAMRPNVSTFHRADNRLDMRWTIVK
jgi:hypothetical protein